MTGRPPPGTTVTPSITVCAIRSFLSVGLLWRSRSIRATTWAAGGYNRRAAIGQPSQPSRQAVWIDERLGIVEHHERPFGEQCRGERDGEPVRGPQAPDRHRCEVGDVESAQCRDGRWSAASRGPGRGDRRGQSRCRREKSVERRHVARTQPRQRPRIRRGEVDLAPAGQQIGAPRRCRVGTPLSDIARVSTYQSRAAPMISVRPPLRTVSSTSSSTAGCPSKRFDRPRDGDLGRCGRRSCQPR